MRRCPRLLSSDGDALLELLIDVAGDGEVEPRLLGDLLLYAREHALLLGEPLGDVVESLAIQAPAADVSGAHPAFRVPACDVLGDLWPNGRRRQHGGAVAAGSAHAAGVLLRGGRGRAHGASGALVKSRVMAASITAGMPFSKWWDSGTPYDHDTRHVCERRADARGVVAAGHAEDGHRRQSAHGVIDAMPGVGRGLADPVERVHTEGGAGAWPEEEKARDPGTIALGPTLRHHHRCHLGPERVPPA